MIPKLQSICSLIIDHIFLNYRQYNCPKYTELLQN